MTAIALDVFLAWIPNVWATLAQSAARTPIAPAVFHASLTMTLSTLGRADSLTDLLAPKTLNVASPRPAMTGYVPTISSALAKAQRQSFTTAPSGGARTVLAIIIAK